MGEGTCFEFSICDIIIFKHFDYVVAAYMKTTAT